MQQVLEEAGRLLKLLWRISLPAGYTEVGGTNNLQVGTKTQPHTGNTITIQVLKGLNLFCYPLNQDELLKNEITRLKNRLSQQERMLSGAVKRLRTTNQLKEGMEKVIIDQCTMKFLHF